MPYSTNEKGQMTYQAFTDAVEKIVNESVGLIHITKPCRISEESDTSINSAEFKKLETLENVLQEIKNTATEPGTFYIPVIETDQDSRDRVERGRNNAVLIEVKLAKVEHDGKEILHPKSVNYTRFNNESMALKAVQVVLDVRSALGMKGDLDAVYDNQRIVQEMFERVYEGAPQYTLSMDSKNAHLSYLFNVRSTNAVDEINSYGAVLNKLEEIVEQAKTKQVELTSAPEIIEADPNGPIPNPWAPIFVRDDGAAELEEAYKASHPDAAQPPSPPTSSSAATPYGTPENSPPNSPQVQRNTAYPSLEELKAQIEEGNGRKTFVDQISGNKGKEGGVGGRS